MNTTWKRFNIFISSTFKDMDFERDIIKFRVIPALNIKYRPRHVALQAIDLRLGVNTAKMSEEESARKVLTVCADNIDSARPFFIGLIGARYGWVPPFESWQEFIGCLPAEDQELMQETYGSSVTELEMVYGALTKRSLDQSHTLFYFRDDASYAGIPDDRLASYCDSDTGQVAKIRDLKQRVVDAISKLGGDDDRVSTYHLDWNADIDDFEENDNEFEQLITKHITALIEAEIKNEEHNGSEWWVREKDVAETYLSKYIGDTFTGMSRFDINPENVILAGDKTQGMTTLLAHLWKRRMAENGDYCLTAVVGLTERSRTMRQIMVRWCLEMEDYLGEKPLDAERFIDPSQKSMAQLCDQFYYDVAILYEKKGKSVSVFVDDIDVFRTFSICDLQLSWVDNRINFVGTCEVLEQMPDFSGQLDVELLNDVCKEESLGLVHFFEHKYHFELPKKVTDSLVAKRRGPLFIKMLFQVLVEGMNSVSIADIRSAKGLQIDAINNYITSFYNDTYRDIGKSSSVVELAAIQSCIMIKMYGLDYEYWRNALSLLAASPYGLTTDDLSEMMGDDWSDSEWAIVSYACRELLIEDPISHVWRVNAGDFSTLLFTYDNDTPFDDLYDYVSYGFDNHWLSPLEDYFNVKRTNEQKYLLPFIGAESARLLVNEGWFTDGSFEAFCEHLSYPERKDLVDSLLGNLFPPSYTDYQADTVGIECAVDNIIEKCNYGFFERRKLMLCLKSMRKVAPKQWSSRLSEVRKVLFRVLDAVDEGIIVNDSLRVFAECSERVKNLSDSGKLVDAMEYQLKALCDLDMEEHRSRIEDLVTIVPVDEPFVLEGLTIWFINLNGAANRVLNSKKHSARVDTDRVAVIASLANDGYLATYHRLCQLCPDNRLSAALGYIIEIHNEGESCWPSTSSIIRCLDELRAKL